MSVTKKKEPAELAFRNGSSDGVVCPSTSSDSNKNVLNGQCIADIEPSELKSKFVPKMIAKKYLADSYVRLGSGTSSVLNEFQEGFETLNPDRDRFGFCKRSFRVKDCGSVLEYSRGIYETGEFEENPRLVYANFCKDRLCPMCNWRRSLKIYGQTSKIMYVIGSKYKFLFLTLTVPNCTAEDLPETLDNMNDGFRRFKRSKEFKNAVKGYHRVLEITINKKDGSYHPHFHVILAVDLSYFDSYKYIKHEKWLQMWRDAMQNPNIKFVNIEKIKSKSNDDDNNDDGICNAVAEVSKYAVKSSDYLVDLDKNGNVKKEYSKDIIDHRVFTLFNALHSRRLSVYGGVFLETIKKLNLDDAEDGDLLHVQDEKLHPFIAEVLYRYDWHAGLGTYKNTSSRMVYHDEGSKKNERYKTLYGISYYGKS